MQEIRYNGRVLKEWIVPLDEPAAAHLLTIVIDDKVATIAGLVTTANGGVSGANVFAVRWPMDQATSGSGAARGQTDAMGRFQITGLAPGEYRVLALAFVPQDIAARITNAAFGTFERFIAAGIKVELRPSELRDISLEPAALPPQ